MKQIKGKTLRGAVRVPASKSVSHRCLMSAALAEGTSTISGLQISEDIEATLRAVKVLGAEVCREGDRVQIKGIHPTQETLLKDPEGLVGLTRYFACGESGSTLRLMMPIGMLWAGDKIYEGEGRLPERPIGEYLRNFDRLEIPYNYSGKLPFHTKGQLKVGDYQLTGKESSQYLSGLLMALPLLKGDSRIEIHGEMESQDYVALTQQVLKSHGIQVTGVEGGYSVNGNQRYKPMDHSVEGDYSQGAFFIVAGLLGREPVTCYNLSENSLQADRRILDIAKAMGGRLEIQKDAVVAYPSKTRGVIIDASQCPDIIPVLAVLASLSEGETQIINGARLRIKESDRIKSTVHLLNALGAEVSETVAGMVIQGKSILEGGTVEGYGDHRIVIAAAIAAIGCQNPVIIKGSDAVKKSYPQFFEDYEMLGGQVDEV